MRFYQIDVTLPDGIRTFTSYVNSRFDPGALNIEFDLLVAPFGTPSGEAGAWVRIWGVSLQDISNAPNFNGAQITIRGGMGAGLPLAKPGQQGVLVQGQVFQSFANWRGTFQCLEFIIIPYLGPLDVSFNWKQGQPLSEALQTTLQDALGAQGYTVQMGTLNAGLVASRMMPAGNYNLVQFVDMLKRNTMAIVGQTANGVPYAGVDVYIKGSTIYVYDGTTQDTPVTIAFEDLIGQPTWVKSPDIQLVTTLRGDLDIGQSIKLPPTFVTTTSASQPQARQNSAQQGAFTIMQIRHVGNFRQASGENWATTINATPAMQ